MSVSLDISPFSDSLDIYGEQDINSAYSLSGHVSISLSSSYSLFDSPRPVRLLLNSLSITFEGQSELISNEFGYAPLRLCSVTRQLAPHEQQQLELSNEGHEHSDKPCTWNVVFNLPIPGWLPPTSTYGDGSEGDAGTRYSLFATANFLSLDDPSDASTWSLASLCSVFRPKSKTVHAHPRPIALRRFITPPPAPFSPQSLFPMSNYAVRAKPEQLPAPPGGDAIPADVVEKIQVYTSVPEYTPVDARAVPITIRLRTTGLEEAQCKRLRVTEFTVDVQQIEKYRAAPSPEFPLPAAQPPHTPLLDPHPYHTLFSSGLMTPPSPTHAVLRAFSIMHPAESGRFALAGDGYVFADDASTTTTAPTWYTISTGVPLARGAGREWSPRAGERGPLFGVRHELRVALTCTYDVPGAGARLTERLHFTLPLHLVHFAPTTAPASASLSAPPTPPYAPTPTLPAYSQLFDANGDRKIDYSVPLPLYTRDEGVDGEGEGEPLLAHGAR